ncbi:MAG: hypothetical protein J7L57_03050 [Deltaproteobacteria bacterium]|nr:hypothetical protein [Candidatus Tharpella sp.]
MKVKLPNKSSVGQRQLWLAWCLLGLLVVIFVLSQSSSAVNLRILKRLGRLIILVGLATFIGSIFELRNWTNFANLLLKPLIAYARLPQIAGAAMVTAIFSNQAAGSLLAGSFSEGRISRFEMRVGAICNSYVAYVSHSLRVMYPIIGALGMPALYYFGMMFGAGLIITLTAMTISRLRPAVAISSYDEPKGEGLQDATFAHRRNPGSWPETFRKAGRRTREIVIRVVCITIPLYVLVSYLNKTGFFEVWKDFVPQIAAPFFPPEVLTIMAARLGGLISAAAVASELLHQGTVSYAHILLALFAGNIITNPIRSLRRNLPTAMGIFPPRDGFFIVMVMQTSRLLFALFFILMLIVYLHLKPG